ncbi:competence protein CoiA family protein [Bacillus mycoides]
MAIEVQASNIWTSNIAKRTNIYFEENVPTAWVLILDSFFPPKEKEVNGEKVYMDSYSGTRLSSFNPETNSYEYTYISSFIMLITKNNCTKC